MLGKNRSGHSDSITWQKMMRVALKWGYSYGSKQTGQKDFFAGRGEKRKALAQKKKAMGKKI